MSAAGCMRIYDYLAFYLKLEDELPWLTQCCPDIDKPGTPTQQHTLIVLQAGSRHRKTDPRMCLGAGSYSAKIRACPSAGAACMLEGGHESAIIAHMGRR